MILHYDIDSLFLVYSVIEFITAKDDSYEEPSFMDIEHEEWYSIKELNQIINN